MKDPEADRAGQAQATRERGAPPGDLLRSLPNALEDGPGPSKKGSAVLRKGPAARRPLEQRRSHACSRAARRSLMTDFESRKRRAASLSEPDSETATKVCMPSSFIIVRYSRK
jgi:hypothetical protein